jgi:hypothetical protein
VGDGLAYRRGCGEEEVEAIIELKLDVPFREAFRSPLNHVRTLAVFGVLTFGEDADDVAWG